MKKVIGVDLGGTNIVTAVVDANGKVLGRDKRPTQVSLGAKQVITRIAESAIASVNASRLTLSQVAAVGIGSPGPLNPKTGVILIRIIPPRLTDLTFTLPVRTPGSSNGIM